MNSLSAPEILFDDFCRRFAQRHGKLMWLLGAGASASAGIPTAYDLISEFKRILYATQRGFTSRSISDLENPSVKALIQAHIDSLGNMPQPGTPEEYAALFEAAYQTEMDRSSFIESKVRGAKPSYGHIALATLMKAGILRVSWTTNFDPLLADACAKVFDGTGHLTVADLNSPELARDRITTERWPIEIKLHGDFRSRRLKNTNEELRTQDSTMRDLLIDSCKRWGLVVVGYSGRDESIMDALNQALESPNAFPNGLFWLHQGEHEPLPAASQFLLRAADAGIEAGLVRIENFDETLRDLLRITSNIDKTVLDAFEIERRRWTAAPIPKGSRGWPIIRLNGLGIEKFPTVCRRINCTIGGHKEVNTAVEEAKVDVITARIRAGVLAFGKNQDLRSAFDKYGITEFDLHTIEPKRLRFDSGERGMLREALSRALSRRHHLHAFRRRNRDLLYPQDPSTEAWTPLRKIVGTLSGSVPGTSGLQWYEGVGIDLDWADERPWLVFEPRAVFTGLNTSNRAAATDFSRERTVKRYNSQLNDIMSFWSTLLSANGEELRAIGIDDGVDAAFKLSAHSCFSRRAGV